MAVSERGGSNGDVPCDSGAKGGEKAPTSPFNPLAPRDVIADSEQDALSQAQFLRWSTDVARDGAVVGVHCHYGAERGERAFDILVGGGRQWADGGAQGFVFPDAALADIRAALETMRTR